MNEINNSVQARLDKFYQNKYIKKFIDDNNLSPSYIFEHLSTFEECLTSLELCKNCLGLTKCMQRKRGEVIGLINEGFVNNSIFYCKEYITNEKYETQLKSFVYSDIPKVHSELFLDNISLNEDEIKKLFGLCVEIYDEDRNKGLYIEGRLGVGKTYMCIALANSLLNKGKKVAFIKTNDFVTKMSQLIREDINEYERIVNRIKKSEYLIFDDIGSENVTEFSRDRLLFNILDYRMENKLCTLFTSNLDLKSLLKHYSIEENSIKAQRLIERISVLCDEFYLDATNKRRISE